MFLSDYVVNSITEFKYKPDKEVTFKAYCTRYGQIFNKECKDWNDLKTRLILRKLAVAEYEHYSNCIFQRKPDINFNDTIVISCKLFSGKSLLFENF